MAFFVAYLTLAHIWMLGFDRNSNLLPEFVVLVASRHYYALPWPTIYLSNEISMFVQFIFGVWCPIFVIVHRYVLYNRWIKIQCYTILDSQARSRHNINHDIVQLIRDVFLLEMCPVFLFESNIHILIARKEHIRSCQHKLLLVVFFPFFHTGLFSHGIIFAHDYCRTWLFS